MASKRRKAAATAVTGADERLSKSAVKRSSRRGAAEGAQDGESPRGGHKAEETCSCKTPKRTVHARSRLPTFGSPANETDIQQEIFWDPQSPVTYKLGKERMKQKASRRTVEISEIVNRIAPQDEKRACSEESLLGLWIGEDAIPCTPGVAKVRSRMNVNGARGLQLKNREEELIKLAKEFDKNMTDAIQDQSAPCHNVHITSETMVSVDRRDEAQVGNQQQFLGEPLQTDIALPFGVVKESAGRVHCENSSQTSIDLDAEGALNALFDGPTQKCSHQLSQGLSNCSSNDSFHENQPTLLEEEHPPDEMTAATESVVEDAHQRQDSAPAVERLEHIPAEKVKTVSERTILSAASSKIESVVSVKLDGVVCDDFDDWGADLLPDDSFLMQITQNPELISTPQNALAHTSNENHETKERTIDSEKRYNAQHIFLNSSNNVPASHAAQKRSIRIGKTKSVLLHDDYHLETYKINSVSKSSQNKVSVSVKPEQESVRESFTRLKRATSTHFPEKRAASIEVPSNVPILWIEQRRNEVHSICHQSPTVSANTRLRNPKKVANQASTGHLKQAEVPKKSVPLFDDWNEPRFSDEVLDLFCESDSLWDTNCDDDDLLYQVCGDVEKRSLSPDVAKENEKAKLVVGSTSKLEVFPCLSVPMQGLSNYPHSQKSHMGRKTFSLDAPVTVPTLLKSESSANTSVQHRRAQFNTDSINSVPGKLYRSHSVPEGSCASVTASPTLSNVCLNVNNIQRQNGLCNVSKIQNNSIFHQVSAEKSKYMFRKTNNSQALVVDHKNVNVGNLSRTNVGLGESKNPPNVLLQTSKQLNTKPAFKRHLSDCFSQSETEEKSRKCSQEEIARKKQEALERRKCKTQALLKNTAPT
ncbi:ewing's tumor-associated antigen 1 isoform X2 [Rhineura floridana]|uniref:ewing's tumor-associated antigen 1 isoform X2 n=1 Tax=Rhineura floridana TaxID=261503 RepID=UPI002AC873D1|nr:ewing's tumor-associated antigen 1 isoform X2 [Rhineura floridana]